MLSVHHHRDGPCLPVDADQLVGHQMAAVFRQQIVERPDRVIGQKRRDRVVGHPADLIGRGRLRKRLRLRAAIMLIEHRLDIAAFHHRLGHRLPCLEPGTQRPERGRVLEIASHRSLPGQNGGARNKQHA